MDSCLVREREGQDWKKCIIKTNHTLFPLFSSFKSPIEVCCFLFSIFAALERFSPSFQVKERKIDKKCII